jgi:hypothetical protein
MPTTAKEYREFAGECLRWATEVEEDQRQAFLDLARDWTLAAMRLEGTLIPISDLSPLPSSTPKARIRRLVDAAESPRGADSFRLSCGRLRRVRRDDRSKHSL